MFPSNGMADLDELVLRCRDKVARSYISEAVLCYKTGAFRAAIVSTWVAIVYDYIHKLQELEFTGDKNAAQKVRDYEAMQQAGDIKRLLEFERMILDTAKNEFELLTELEHLDLSRLQDDRNRCAHPSMNSPEEIYQPSAELTRTHIRNAIEYMLQRPPVQGKAALARIESEIQSEYFPSLTDDAVKLLQNGPLARPRDSLVRNLTIVLTKALLSGELKKGWYRYAAALNAIRQLHKRIVDELFEERLNELLKTADDEVLILRIRFIKEIHDTWQYLKDDNKYHLENFVKQMPKELLIDGFPDPLDVPELNGAAVYRINRMDADDISGVLSWNEGRVEFVDRAISLYKESGNYYVANNLAKNILMPLIPYFDNTHIEKLIKSAHDNKQILHSDNLDDVFSGLIKTGKFTQDEFDSMMRRHGIQRIDNGFQIEFEVI